ncbi:oligoendopeptidase F family protein [bacterium]|nr:oligoendopeptidase F family protein [bacterium]
MNWDLTKYYKTYEDFRENLNVFKDLVEKLKDYKGTLNDEVKFREYYDILISIVENYEKLYLYANCKIDIDRNNIEAVNDFQDVLYTFQKLNENTSFEDSEILSLKEDYVFSVIEKYDELKQLKFSFTDLFRKKAHTPSSLEQKIIANYSSLSDNNREIFSSLSTSDVKPHMIKLDSGEEIDIKDANWTSMIRKSKSVSERKRIFEAEFKRFDEYKNTYAAIYLSTLKADIALAKSKGFDTAIEMYLYRNNIPVSLYLSLIEIAHDTAPLVKKYLELRKKFLKLDEYHTYDRFLDLVQDENSKKYSYEDAKNLFFASIEKYDEEFRKFAHTALEDGYVDVYPKDGKVSGAYSNSTSNAHPCILLNFNEDLDSCFTLAHEAGHSTHSLFSMKYQDVMTTNYTIFVAEIASTFNEHNLLDYLIMKGTLTRNEKIKLISNAIDNIVATFMRQTLFAEYEYIAHTMAEKGEAITEESLSNIMVKLYQEYYGLDINKEIYKKYVWVYVHHFFMSPYYVYQYATSFAASLAIYQNVKEGKENAFNNYLDLLKSGGSDYPIELVKKAGVDFTNTDCLKAVKARFKDLLNELEEAINE